MSGNFFDQFDPQPASTAPAEVTTLQTGGNFFDQFDVPGRPSIRPMTPGEVDQDKWQNPVMERIRQATLGAAHAIAHPIDTASSMISAAQLPGEVYSGEANLNDPETLNRAISLGLMISPGAPEFTGAKLAGSLPATPPPAVATGAGTAPFALRRAAEGMMPANVEDAAKLIDAAKSQGIDLPWTQAIQEASGGATNFTNLERYIGGTSGGAPLRGIMAQRPAQVEASGRSVLGALKPEAPTTPAQAGLAVQEAARQSLLDTERARTAATSPLYQAANPVEVAPEGMGSLINDMDQAITRDKTGVVTSEVKRLRDMISHVPPAIGTEAPNRVPHLDINNLNNARIITQERLGMPQVGADAVTKKQASAVAPFLGRLRMMMEQASPDFKAANEKFAAITKEIVKPEQSGPLGQIAKTQSLAKQAGALFPTGAAIVPGQEAVLGAAVKKLAARDPQAAEGVVHAHLQSMFDASTKSLQGGQNAMGGANFAKALMGNAQEAKNVREIISALPNGRERLAGVQKLVDVLRATGRAATAGSPTAPLQEIQREARHGIVATAGSVFGKPGQALREFAQKFEMGLNTEAMAKIITNRNSVGLFRDLAKQEIVRQNTGRFQKAMALAYKLTLIGQTARGLRTIGRAAPSPFRAVPLAQPSEPPAQ